MTTKKTKQAEKAKKTPVIKAILWLYATAFFIATAVLLIKSYSNWAVTFIALQQLAIAGAIVIVHFIKAQK